MSLFEDPNPRELKDLLAEVYSRAMVLPDFQQDFVCEPGAKQRLIVSIAIKDPAGNALVSSQVRDNATALANLGGVA